VIENHISQDAYRVWQYVHDLGDVPIAPVFRVKAAESKVIVLSRYCGLSISQYQEFLSDDLDYFWSEVLRQKKDILLKLEKRGIVHGHPHDANFTVEFLKREAYDEIQNQNTKKYAEPEITPDPELYFSNPDEWVIQVRLIDWDQGRLTQK